jgi:hypothetical protein
MSNFNRESFTYHTWTVQDTDKQRFTAQAALDTFVRNRLVEMDKFILEGKPFADAAAWLFTQFNWFVGANRLMQLVSAKHHFNYVFLGEILTYHFESMYYISCVVHFDGEFEEI